MSFQRFPMWVHHPDSSEPSVLVHDEDAEAEVLKKWNVGASKSTDVLRESLMERAAKVNLKVDNNWSDVKLGMEVETAEAKAKTAPKKAD